MYPRPTSLILMMMWTSLALSGLAQTAAGWRTYRDPDYGFAIAFPPSFTLIHASSGIAGTGEETSNDRDHPGYGCQPTSLACFQYNRPTFSHAGIFELGVTVNALQENATEAECYQIDEGDHLANMMKTVRINGIVFHSGDASDGWTGHGVGMTKYRVFRRNLCFEIEITEGVYDFAPEEDDYHAPDPRALRRVRRDQESIVRTFAFVDVRSNRLRRQIR
jgi:hypothetical protein